MNKFYTMLNTSATSKYNQQSVKPGMVFKPLLPSVKDQITNWLHE